MDIIEDRSKNHGGPARGRAMLKRLMLLLGAVLLVQCQALAQFSQSYPQQKKKWEFSFLTGFSSSSDQSSATPLSGDDSTMLVGLDYASGYLLGVRVTENLGEHFGAELEYSFANQPLSFVNLGTNLPRLNLDHREHSIDYNVLYYPFPPSAQLRPYAVVGIGACFYQLDGDSRDLAAVEGVTLNNRWKLAGVWGGGVKYYLDNKWGVRFDVRNQITGIPDYGLPHTATSFQGVSGAAFRPNGTMQTWQFSAGVLFVWNGF